MTSREKRYSAFLALTKERKQTYEFGPKKVSSADIRRILEAARWTPSCQNAQPWRFIVIDDKALIAAIVENATQHVFSPFINPLPPLLIAFVLDTASIHNGQHRCSEGPEDKKLEANLCVAMCVQTAVLAAAALGINSCILTPKPTEIRQFLKSSDPIPLIVGFGYESKTAFPRARSRKPLNQLIRKGLPRRSRS